MIGIVVMLMLAGCNKPSKVDQYRAEKHVRDSVGLVDQQRSLDYYQQQLDSLLHQADSLLCYFKYEKNERYQDQGNYIRDDGKEILLYRDGKRIEATNDPQFERAQHLQIVINDIKELEKRIAKTSLEIQKYQKRL